MNKELSKLTTIVIVTINGKILIDVLKKLQKKYKIIIVENNNDKNFKKSIEENNQNIEVILPEKNLGFGAGNNIGLKKVTTPYALILNPDVDIDIKNIETLEFYSKNINEFSILTLNSNSFKNIIENKLDKFEPNFNFDENSNEEFTELPWVPGWCMFFKTNDIKQLNYFDENIFLYFDELDLCKRFKKDNGKFYLLRNSLVKHEFHGTSKNLNKTKHLDHWKLRSWHFQWSSFYYHQKHYGFAKSALVHVSKYFRYLIKRYYFLILNNDEGYQLNKSKSDGILSSFFQKKSSYRVDL